MRWSAVLITKGTANHRANETPGRRTPFVGKGVGVASRRLDFTGRGTEGLAS